jgi:hypothetical protein
LLSKLRASLRGPRQQPVPPSEGVTDTKTSEEHEEHEEHDQEAFIHSWLRTAQTEPSEPSAVLLTELQWR